jgi:hypothetical protein
MNEFATEAEPADPKATVRMDEVGVLRGDGRTGGQKPAAEDLNVRGERGGLLDRDRGVEDAPPGSIRARRARCRTGA